MENNRGNTSMNDNLIENIFLLISMMPLFIGGLALFMWSFKLEKKAKDPNKPKVKKPNLYDAKVIDVQTIEKRDETGYLRSRYYSTTIEYEKNGELRIQTFDCSNEYPTNSIIEAYIYTSGLVSVITEPPTGYNFSNKKVIYVTGWKVARIAGFVLAAIPVLSILAQISFLQWLPAIAILFVFVGIPILLGIKFYKSGKKKLADIENGIYETYMATIIDIKKTYHKTDNGGHYDYYPIVQFDYKGESCTTLINANVDKRINDIGTNMPLYIHRDTGEMLLSIDKTVNLLPAYIAFGVAGFFAFFLFIGLF
jgi:hypothetical protein